MKLQKIKLGITMMVITFFCNQFFAKGICLIDAKDSTIIKKNTIQIDIGFTDSITLAASKDSVKVKKNRVQIDVGGAANIVKFSYSRDIYLTSKLVIAPRIGFSTLGLDFKLLMKNKFEFIIGSRFLFLLIYPPIGKPIPFGKRFYEKYIEQGSDDGALILPSFLISNYIGLNYNINSFFINFNIAVHSLIVRDNRYANDLLSIGVGIGKKI